MPQLTTFILATGLLLLAGIIASRISERFSVPSLVLFLGLGMLAGSEGIGGIAFDSTQTANSAATVALLVILFTGGLHAKWKHIKPVLVPGLVLSTAGVLLTTLFLGTFAWFILGSYSTFNLGTSGLSFIEALLLAAIVSSTDAAAVFSVFRTSPKQPSKHLRNLLEFESGSNDPMAVLLTTVLLHAMIQPEGPSRPIVVSLALQFIIGGSIGCTVGFIGAKMANKMTKITEGLSPILVLAFGFITYGVADISGGNGFLAVYLAGLVIGNKTNTRKDSILSFHDGLSWLFQILMFIMLGLLVFPSQLMPVAGIAIALAFFLMLIARPLSVFLCMWPFKMPKKELTYLSWVGLRGAVPIVLATFPGFYGIEGAETIFNVIFFIVLVSVVVQGMTLVPVANWLNVCKKQETDKD